MRGKHFRLMVYDDVVTRESVSNPEMISKVTTAWERPDPDLGTRELRQRKIRVANGSAATVELVDIVGVLHANELIVAALRLLADWLRQLRVGLGLRQASAAGLWAAIASGTGLGSVAMSGASGGDRALFRLTELHRHFTTLDRTRSRPLARKVLACRWFR